MLRRLKLTRADLRPDSDASVSYSYHDADGNLLYEVERLAGKKFRQRRPDGRKGWIWNMRGVPRVLYALPGIMKNFQQTDYNEQQAETPQ